MGVVRKEPCPQCRARGEDRSGDNLNVYEGGGKYCFACEYVEPSPDYQEEKFISTMEDFSKEDNDALKARTTCKANGLRGIRDDIYTYFGVRHQLNDKNQPIKQYYPNTLNYELSGYKIRILPKTFSAIGTVSKECDLFGQFRFKDAKGKYVVVTGGECFKGDVELFTDKGFVRFDQLTKEEMVAQYLENGFVEFVKPLDYINKDYSGTFVKRKNRRYSMESTSNHNLVYLDSNDKLVKKQACEHVPNNYSILVNGLHEGEGIPLSDDQIALTLAICADSKIDVKKSHKLVHFAFIKERKIKRLKDILDSLNVRYTSYINTYANGKTYTTFNFILPDYIKDKTIPKEWIKLSTLRQKEFILDEIVEWDGNHIKGRNGFEFSSKYFSECSTVSELAVLSGKYSKIRKRTNQLGSWYCVRVSKIKKFLSTQQLSKEEYYYNGKVYCVTVPSGMIIVRVDGCISVVGNCDQLSAFQMLRDYTLSKGGKYDDIPVVSPVTGETSAFKQLQQNYEWFDRFERIILCFDNDKAGKEATEKASKVLPKGKVYTMDMIHKDPNVYLTEHKEREWISCFFDAKPYTPAGVHASTVLYKAACDNLDQGVLSLPPFMRKAASMLGDGLVKQEISLFLAKTSIGKTTLMSALTEWWALNEPNEVLGVLSLEATAPKYSRNLLSYYLKVPLHRIKDPEERKAFLEKPEITEKINRLYVRDDGRPTFYLCDDRGANTDQIKEKILEMIIKLGVTVLMIDPYSDLLSGMSVPEQEDLATWLKKIMKEYGITIVVVSHVRKSSNNSDDQITEDSAQGSSFLVKAAGQTIALERDKQSECPVERNRTKITILKNRDFSETGPAGSIYYDIDTASLYDYDEWIIKHPKEETIDF